MSKHQRNGATFIIGESAKHPPELLRTRSIEVQLDGSSWKYYVGEDCASAAIIIEKIERGVFDIDLENIRAAAVARNES